MIASRDIDHVQISQQVREIGLFAFNKCQKLKSLKFDQNLIFEKISYAAFEYISGLGCISLPESVTRVDNLFSVTFNSSSIYVDLTCVYQCKKISNMYFPKPTMLTLDCSKSFITSLVAMCKINVRKSAQINGKDVKIEYHTIENSL